MTTEAIIPVEEIVNVSLWGLYTGSIGIFCIIALCITTLICLRFAIYESLRFNYHYYIRYGEFVIIWAQDDEHDKRKQVVELAKELGITGPETVSWAAAFLIFIAATILGLLLALAWPVTTIFVMPLLIVRAIAYRKRKKASFVQKLSGDHLKKNAQ